LATISLAGIDKAISSLGYQNSNSLKFRFVRAIRQYYDSDEAIGRIGSIDSDQLIRAIWQIDETNISAQSKHKNLQSIKTSVNKDLIELFERGNNPEGIIVGPSNTFVMSHQAKDKLLQSFSNSVPTEGNVSLSKIVDVLNIIREALSGPPLMSNNRSVDEIDKIKTILKALNEEIEASSEEEKQFKSTATKPTASTEKDETDPAGEGAGETDADSGETVEVLVEDEPPEAGFDQPGDLNADEDLEEIAEDEIEDLSDPETAETPEGEEAGETDADSGEAVEVLAEDESPELADENFEDERQDDSIDAIDEAEIDANDTTELEDGEGENGQEIEGDFFDAMKTGSTDELSNSNVMTSFDPATGDLPIDPDREEEFADGEGPENEKERILAEKFDSYLGAMDRYYNQYILVPAGEFIVGNKEPEGDERQEDKIIFPNFYVGKYPVTNSLFEVFIERTGYKTTAEELGYGVVFHGRFHKIPGNRNGFAKSVWNASCSRKIVKGACWYQPFGPGSMLNKKRNHPVVQVSYKDAVAFAAWTGKRLPTESEWEAAARTPTGYIFPWGNEWQEGICNTEECAISDTTPVDHYHAGINDFGIADILGNVLEWTADECDPLYSDNRDIRYHIAKGGSWISDRTVSLFSRFRFEPKFTSNILGFRCVAD
jgi:formylglycine-generating enzyme required for sulfatase activity